MIFSRYRYLVFVCMCGWLVACATTNDTTPTPMTTPVPLTDLQFDDSTTRDRFVALDHCANEVAQGEAWRRIPYTFIGNFYEAKWCSGAGAREDCQIAEGSRYNRDQHVVTLSTLHYPDTFPNVFGTVFNVLRVPPTEGWGVQYYYSEGGQTIVGGGSSITFNFFGADGEPADIVEVSYNPSYRVHETTIYVPVPDEEAAASVHDGITPFLTSATTMRDLGLKKTEALAAEVTKAIQEKRVQMCEYGPSQGNLPPECTLRELTEEETAQALADADAYFARQRELLTTEYEAMYTALQAAFPFETCWK